MNSAEHAPVGTRAHTPDLNWSQVRETVLMLQLGVGQIEAAFTESHNSVEMLTQSFTSMADYVSQINNMLQALPLEGEANASRNQLLGTAYQLTSMVHQAIIAFQFYDRLTQRLNHVSHGLDCLSDLVNDQRRLFVPAEWVALQEGIKAKYTTAEEREMFEAVMRGVPVKEALEQFVSNMKNKGDDIEFF